MLVFVLAVVLGSFTNVIWALKEFGALPFIFVLIVVQAFLIINLKSFVPADELDKYETAMMLYMILTGLFLGLAGKIATMKNKNVPFFSGSLISGFTKFGLAFFIIFGFMKLFVTPFTVEKTGIGTEFIFFIFVVAVSEEFIFRYGLPKAVLTFLRGNAVSSPAGVETGVAMIGSSFAFALFHASVYQFSLSSMMFAFIMGMVFYVVAVKGGVEYAMGIHAAYNLCVAGVI